jgi:site-specific recombinase XerD
MTPLAPLIESFFTDRLCPQLRASQNTVSAYRDTFRLLLGFSQKDVGKAPSELSLADVDAPLVGRFLTHLEAQRRNSARSRNARLSAIHSFFHYVAFLEPAHSGLIQRVLAIPHKRCERNLVNFLTRPELEAVLRAPDQSTWHGRRDYALLLVAVQTGLRVSELIDLRPEQLVLGTGAHIRCHGKGRKERCVPLTRQVAAVLKAWIAEQALSPADPVFQTRRGGGFSRDGIEQLVAKHAAKAASACPSLQDKRVSPHVLRHTTAMRLLQSDVDCAVIALWLGHESVETTGIYLHADLTIKERALAKTAPTYAASRRYRPGDRLLAFLNGL